MRERCVDLEHGLALTNDVEGLYMRLFPIKVFVDLVGALKK